MEPKDKHSQSERAATDESLGVEREKTDEELSRRRADIDESADQVIAGARSRADKVLRSARTKADQMSPVDLDSPEHAAMERERSREDDVLRRERTTADTNLSVERDARRRALAALLALEREQTDDRLLLERHRADAAIGTRDDFLGMVSHDLRNLLGGMALSASSLLTIQCEEEIARAVARNAQRIQQYTARMDRLVGDLLDVVSIEAGRLALSPRRDEPSELLSETTEVFFAIAAAKGISLQSATGPGSVRVSYDRERVLQVLANLVGNAIKFTPKGGSIELRLEPIDGGLRFSVTDTGIGVAPEKLERIFDRFWRADERQTGVGLGLYISKCIVEAHGGRIWVDSRVGEGSTVYFTLPLS
jgi:signal transduction histidine kinase